jgi:hypothetical protein
MYVGSSLLRRSLIFDCAALLLQHIRTAAATIKLLR